MQANGFFDDIGETLGNAIHGVVTFLLSLFDNTLSAAQEFVDGLTRSLGISGSLFSILVLIVGLWLLFGGLRALLRGALIGAVVRVAIGLLVLSWLLV
ncbi:hypothetical protein [Vreelandella jeotgali]|uniref:hypothetical protein n=1 Tax=Vreelandella jeotgali TaxID=553386 RepID=UPI00034B08FF|nr:hypothetical protein [Halomonas jeotgali]